MFQIKLIVVQISNQLINTYTTFAKTKSLLYQNRFVFANFGFWIPTYF